MTVVRVGCVEHLKARPLWHGLGSRPYLFSLQYGVPSKVSAWLHSGDVELALVSSIEYGQQYRVVPGFAVTPIGPVASVAMFSKKARNRCPYHRSRFKLAHSDNLDLYPLRRMV